MEDPYKIISRYIFRESQAMRGLNTRCNSLLCKSKKARGQRSQRPQRSEVAEATKVGT